MELVSMCIYFGSSTFEGEEYLQQSGLAMNVFTIEVINNFFVIMSWSAVKKLGLSKE